MATLGRIKCWPHIYTLDEERKSYISCSLHGVGKGMWHTVNPHITKKSTSTHYVVWIGELIPTIFYSPKWEVLWESIHQKRKKKGKQLMPRSDALVQDYESGSSQATCNVAVHPSQIHWLVNLSDAALTSSSRSLPTRWTLPWGIEKKKKKVCMKDRYVKKPLFRVFIIQV
jgi:hypothetical protein